MYSVEITVEKDKVTGETRVLSSSTLPPRGPLPQGIKVYEDETKGMKTHCSAFQADSRALPSGGCAGSQGGLGLAIAGQQAQSCLLCGPEAAPGEPGDAGS